MSGSKYKEMRGDSKRFHHTLSARFAFQDNYFFPVMLSKISKMLNTFLNIRLQNNLKTFSENKKKRLLISSSRN